MRWRSAGSAMRLTSSGVTKSRPSSSAAARAARTSEMPPRGPAPATTPGPGARRAHQADRVVEHRVVDAQRRGDASAAAPPSAGLSSVATCSTFSRSPTLPSVTWRTMRRLLGLARVVDPHLEQEAVELRLGQRVGAFLLDRVLRGEHHERRLERERLALDRHLALLHHLEQRRLRLGRRAVDLVGQQQVGEHRAAARGEHLVLRVVERVAGDVGRHQVGRELDAAEGAGDGARQRAHEQRLAQARHALDQHVAAGEQRAQHLVDDLGLADQRLADLGAHRLRDLGRLRELLGGGFCLGVHFFPFSKAACMRCACCASLMKSAPRIAPPAARKRLASSWEMPASAARRETFSACGATAKSGCARARRRSAASRAATTSSRAQALRPVVAAARAQVVEQPAARRRRIGRHRAEARRDAPQPQREQREAAASASGACSLRKPHSESRSGRWIHLQRRRPR